jgi:hypothetical protein
MINLEFWYNNTLEEVTEIDCFFYPNAGEYRGNLYINGKAVGDYTTRNSSEIEKIAPGIFGE